MGDTRAVWCALHGMVGTVLFIGMIVNLLEGQWKEAWECLGLSAYFVITAVAIGIDRDLDW